MLRILAASLILLSSCRPSRDLSQYTQEDPKSSLTSNLKTGNERYSAQLISGFHRIEEGRWRWVERKFVAALRAPFASQKLGAKLILRGNLPEVILSRTGPILLSAKLNQTQFPPQKFSAVGDVIYTVDVPAAALSADRIVVEFTTDKFLPPATFPNDGRELALIVTSISLETKK